jgi:hypothetical protein
MLRLKPQKPQVWPELWSQVVPRLQKTLPEAGCCRLRFAVRLGDLAKVQLGLWHIFDCRKWLTLAVKLGILTVFMVIFNRKFGDLRKLHFDHEKARS